VETCRLEAIGDAKTTLQWGHAFSGVETSLDMNNSFRLYKLQWGHAFSGVETPLGDFKGLEMAGFNGATPFQAWKLKS